MRSACQAAAHFPGLLALFCGVGCLPALVHDFAQVLATGVVTGSLQEFVSGLGRSASCGLVHLQLLPPHARLASPRGAGRHRHGPNPRRERRAGASRRRSAKPAALWRLLLLLDRFAGDAGTWEGWGLGGTRAQPDQRRGPRACPDLPARCGVCWRPVGRPLPPSAAFPLGGPEPSGGRHGAPPEPPAAECVPPVGGPALGLPAHRYAFPFQEKPDRFAGDAGTRAPPSAGYRNEMGGPPLVVPFRAGGCAGGNATPTV